MKRILTALVLCSTLASAQVTGYTFSQSTPGYTPVVGTTVFSGVTDDSLSASIPLGFSFFYGSTSFTDIRVCSNGWLGMGTAATTTTNYTSISGTTPNVLAPFSADLQGNTAGNVQTLLSGAPGTQVFTVQWTNYRRWNTTLDTGDNFNFQVNLYEGTNNIEFVYGSMTTTLLTTGSCQVGLKGAATAVDFNNRLMTIGVHTWATTVAGTANTANCGFSNIDLPATGTSFFYSAPPPFLAVNPTVSPSGVVASGATVTIQATVAVAPAGFPVGSVVTTIDLTNAGGFPGTPMNDLGGGLFEVITPVFGSGTVTCPIDATDGVLVGAGVATLNFVPTNDECVNAIPLVVGTNGPFSNANATNGLAAPVGCGPVATGGTLHDVWFSFVPTCPGAHTISTGCGGFDSVVAAYDACGGTLLGCDDDSAAAGCIFIGGGTFTINCIAGNTYFIRVASWTANTSGSFPVDITAGSGGLNLTFSAPLGPGSIQAEIINGQPFGGYFFAVTFAAGAFPNGWLGGLDIPFSDLINLINAGFPFVGPLGACGEFTIGPFGGLPSGLSIWGTAIGTTFPLGPVTGIAPASTFTIP